MENGDAIEEINTLASSKNRVDILRLLRGRGEVDKRVLKERFDVSRPTLQRNLDTLEDAGWVQHTLDGYVITVAGQMITRQFSDLVGSVETAGRLQPLLRWIPRGDFDLDPLHLADAEVTVSEPSNPYAPANRFVKRLQTTEEFRAFMAVVARDATELVTRRVKNGQMAVELVLTSDAFETLRADPGFTDLTADVLDDPGFDILVVDGDVPFFLGLLDDEVHIGVEDDGGVPRALAITRNEAVRDWALAKYERVKRRSDTRA